MSVVLQVELDGVLSVVLDDMQCLLVELVDELVIECVVLLVVDVFVIDVVGVCKQWLMQVLEQFDVECQQFVLSVLCIVVVQQVCWQELLGWLCECCDFNQCNGSIVQ